MSACDCQLSLCYPSIKQEHENHLDLPILYIFSCNWKE